MKKYQFKTYQIADIGDYLKVFACTAVMAQPIMAMIMGIGQPTHTQDILQLSQIYSTSLYFWHSIYHDSD